MSRRRIQFYSATSIAQGALVAAIGVIIGIIILLGDRGPNQPDPLLGAMTTTAAPNWQALDGAGRADPVNEPSGTGEASSPTSNTDTFPPTVQPTGDIDNIAVADSTTGSTTTIPATTRSADPVTATRSSTPPTTQSTTTSSSSTTAATLPPTGSTTTTPTTGVTTSTTADSTTTSSTNTTSSTQFTFTVTTVG